MRKTNKQLIFIIEDSVDIQDLIRLVYEGEGYTVESASSGREALDKLQKISEVPCFILLDLMMPGMDGFQFRKIQEQDPRLVDVPVIVLSADAQAETKAIAMGARGYIKKPVDLQALLDIAAKFCQ